MEREAGGKWGPLVPLETLQCCHPWAMAGMTNGSQHSPSHWFTLTAQHSAGGLTTRRHAARWVKPVCQPAVWSPRGGAVRDTMVGAKRWVRWDDAGDREGCNAGVRTRLFPADQGAIRGG